MESYLSSLTFTVEPVAGDGVARVAGTEVRAGSVGADVLTEVQGLTTLVDLWRGKICNSNCWPIQITHAYNHLNHITDEPSDKRYIRLKGHFQ